MSRPVDGPGALVARESARDVVASTEQLLARTTERQAGHAISASTREFVRSIEILATGRVRPMPFDLEAPAIDSPHIAASVRRYGVAMTRDIQHTVQVGLANGLSQQEIVASLSGRFTDAERVVQDGQVMDVSRARPIGIFRDRVAWAERIVRTETARAYNQGVYASLLAARNEDPRIKKKILARLDRRTAPDSLAVHGQVREVNDTFLDGAGRVYLMPPARPNDREIVIAWMDEWGENDVSRPLTQTQIEEHTKIYRRTEAT